MNFERKRVATTSSRDGVVVGSVWESRMRGSFKVFSGNDRKNANLSPPTENPNAKKLLRSKESPNGAGKRKTWKSDGNSEATERNPVQISRFRSENKKKLGEISNESSDSMDGIKKVKPVSTKGAGISESSNGNQEIEGGNRNGDEINKNRLKSSENLEEFGVICEEKLMTADLEKVKPQQATIAEDEELGGEINEERSIVVVEEMKPISEINKNKTPDVVLIENKRIHERNQRSNSDSKTVNSHSKPNDLPYQRVPKSHNKLQSFIDLIMWKDASKSALVFGFGTFAILSSSYTNDLNISFISVISYMGLIYLAAIFIFRSTVLRGVAETDYEEHVLGEEEAVWALKLFLPYINEFLFKLKALFSGDPATTMKLAVLLFVLARCGSSITIWKMAKLGFFAVFTLPKICSSYSSQLSEYGTFWVQRFKDAWESCSQKKVVAFGIFALVWNLSSIVARIWAVFMLFVAFKYYQQSMVKDERVEEEEEEEEEKDEEEEPVLQKNLNSWRERRHGRFSVSSGNTKLKKRS